MILVYVDDLIKSTQGFAEQLQDQLIGKLHYLVHGTRPDIANAVRELSRHLKVYTTKDWKMAKSVLQYLKHTVNFGIVYSGNEQDRNALFGCCDADFAIDEADRQSKSGNALLMANGCISFDCTKMKSVA